MIEDPRLKRVRGTHRPERRRSRAMRRRPVPRTGRSRSSFTVSRRDGPRGARFFRSSRAPGYLAVAPDLRGYGASDRPARRRQLLLPRVLGGRRRDPRCVRPRQGVRRRSRLRRRPRVGVGDGAPAARRTPRHAQLGSRRRLRAPDPASGPSSRRAGTSSSSSCPGSRSGGWPAPTSASFIARSWPTASRTTSSAISSKGFARRARSTPR